MKTDRLKAHSEGTASELTNHETTEKESSPLDNIVSFLLKTGHKMNVINKTNNSIEFKISDKVNEWIRTFEIILMEPHQGNLRFMSDYPLFEADGLLSQPPVTGDFYYYMIVSSDSAT